jgi:uncharacterized membrane protein
LRSGHAFNSTSTGFLSKAKSFLSSQLHNYGYLHLMVVLYVISFSINTLIRHYTFASSAWDLGIFNQALYTTVKQGKLFYYTPELYANPSGTIFGVHFSPILFLVIPFYIILPKPETLLVIQTIVLASGVYPTFLIAKKTLQNRSISLLFSLLYLIYCHLHSVNLFDFHPDAFFVPFALFSWYFFTKQKWTGYFLFLLLCFFTKETSSIPFLVVGLIDAWSMREKIVTSFRKSKFQDRRIFIPIATIAISILWYAVATAFIHFFNPSPSSRFVQGTPWGIFLGENPLGLSILESITTLDFSGALQYEFNMKLFYLFTILAPLAFLPVIKYSYFLPVVPWLLLAFLSNYSPYYGLGYHYSAIVVPFAIIAAVYGLERLGLTFNLNEKRLLQLLKKVVLVALLFALSISIMSLPLTKIELLSVSKHDKYVYEAIKIIPPEASVLTQYDIFPHLSSRVNSFVVPPPFEALKRDYYYSYVKTLFGKGIEFILIDINPDIGTHALWVTHLTVLNEVARNGSYGLYASMDGALVYKYAYQGEPIVYEPFTILRDYEFVHATVVDRNKIILEYPLPTGNYTVTYRMKVYPKVEGLLFTIEVHQDMEVLAFRDVNGEEFSAANTYQNFSLTFSVLDSTKEFKFSIDNLSDQISVDLGSIEVTQISYSTN